MLYTRNIAMLKPVIFSWLRKDVLYYGSSKKPYTTVYSLKFFSVAKHVQMRLVNAFFVDLAKALFEQIRKISVSFFMKKISADRGRHAGR